MRGEERRQRAMLMIVEHGDRVPKKHPLRRGKEFADAALTQRSLLFDEMYSAIGRPSILPVRLLKASLLMALHTVRSERMFCEQLDYNLLFRWFLAMDVAESSFDHSTFSRNRAAVGARRGARVFRPRGRAGPQSAVAFGRTLYRGWHAGRGLGVAQKLQAQAPETDSAARRLRQPDG
jgi:transposase